MLDKFGLYVQHLENIIADESKQTNKATLEGKRRKMVKSSTFLMAALLNDLLEPAKHLRHALVQIKNFFSF